MKPTFPVRSCREAVWNGVGSAYACELGELHPGPCASPSVHQSMVSRQLWEGAHPEQPEQPEQGDR